jgi:hypothetical protein
VSTTVVVPIGQDRFAVASPDRSVWTVTAAGVHPPPTSKLTGRPPPGDWPTSSVAVATTETDPLAGVPTCTDTKRFGAGGWVVVVVGGWVVVVVVVVAGFVVVVVVGGWVVVVVVGWRAGG